MQSGPLQSMKFGDLTEVYREERSKSLLSNVRSDLYPALSSLLLTLKSEYDRLLTQDPDSIMCEGANQRRMKANRLVRDVVALRMQKITSMALRTASGAQSSTDILTSEEKKFHESVLEASRSHMSSVDRATGHVKYKIPPIEDVPKPKPKVSTASEPESLKDMPVIDDVPDYEYESQMESDFEIDDDSEMEIVSNDVVIKEEPVSEIISSPKAVIALEEDDSDEDKCILIRILEDLPVFAGPDRDYDLKREELITMPKSMADALIQRAKAILVKPSP